MSRIKSSPATARKRRQESRIAKAVRQIVSDRDGRCRLHNLAIAGDSASCGLIGKCAGLSEWAHFGEYRRSNTRKMAPTLRHRPQGSLMLCSAHHTLQHQGRLIIEAENTTLGCDGPLRFTLKEPK